MYYGALTLSLNQCDYKNNCSRKTVLNGILLINLICDTHLTLGIIVSSDGSGQRINYFVSVNINILFSQGPS